MPPAAGSGHPGPALVAVPTAAPALHDAAAPLRSPLARRALQQVPELEDPQLALLVPQPPAQEQPLQESRLLEALQPQRQPCSHCGGSGMLRISVQSHRTCLDCLGGGQRLLTSADLLRGASLRAAVSASAAG